MSASRDSRRILGRKGKENPQKANYDWEELVRYWKAHNRGRGQFSYESDPEGLNNVCQSGAPIMVNRYYHRSQQRVFRSLVALVPPPHGDSYALDIGCGAGRWSRILHERGYKTTGIDIQDDLLTTNRVRYPRIDFRCVPIQELDTEIKFDLITSVTVLQHLPYEHQKKAIEKIAAISSPGGFVLILENVAQDSSPHMFTHSTETWTELFNDVGLSHVRHKRYDYSPTLRSYYWSTRAYRGWHARPAVDLPDPEQLGTRRGMAVTSGAMKADNYLKRMACAVDSLLEPALIRLELPVPTVHCGMLFRNRATADDMV